MFWLVEWRHRSLVAPMWGSGRPQPVHRPDRSVRRDRRHEQTARTVDETGFAWPSPPIREQHGRPDDAETLDQPDVGAIPGLPRLMEYMTVEHGFVMVSVAFASGGARGRRSVRASRSTTRNAQKPNVTAGRSTVRSGRPSRSGNG